MENQRIELYEYILYADKDRGLFTYSSGMVAARNLQEATEKAMKDCQHDPYRPENAYIAVRQYGTSSPMVWE